MSLQRFKSLEFILLVLTNLGAWAATAADTLSTRQAVIASTLSVVAYALARGLAKFNADGKPFYFTSEFWIAVLGAAGAGLANLNGTIPDSTLKLALAGVAAATMIANGLRTPPAVGTQVGKGSVQ